MPETLFIKMKENIKPQWKVCFIFSLIVGLITHMYKLTSWLPNWDSLVFRYDGQNMLAIGRWFLPVVCAPSSFYDLPWVAGLLALLLHALGAVCICRMFSVEKSTTSALIGATVIAFPTVTSVLTYNYVADGYAFAFLLSCLAGMLLVEKKPRYIASAICITLSAGIYQAYVTVTVMLLLCYLITEGIRKDTRVITLVKKTLQFLATGIVGMVLYYVIMRLALKLTHTELLEYQGISGALSLSLSSMNIFASLYTVKTSFVEYFFDFSNGASVFSVLNCVILVLTVVLYIFDIVKNRTSLPKLLIIAFCTIMLPIGASVLAFINSDVDYHNLMKMGFVVFYLFLILQYEKQDFKSERLNAIKAWGILAVVFVLVFNYVIIANVSYHKLNMAYEKSYGVLVRIADRIEQTEGASECERILVVGALDNSEPYSVNLPPDMTGTTDGFILRADDEVVGQSVLCSALNDYCGTDYTFVYGDEKTALVERADEMGMGLWPASDSVAVIDGVIVIYLGMEGR